MTSNPSLPASQAPGQDAVTHDTLRDSLEQSQILAEDANLDVLAHIIAMALEELNEVEGLGAHYALLLREASTRRPGN